MYTAFCDILAGGIYKGTIVLRSSPIMEVAQNSAANWFLDPQMQHLRSFYEREYDDAEFVSYYKKVS
jgi:hypothetical protein